MKASEGTWRTDRDQQLQQTHQHCNVANFPPGVSDVQVGLFDPSENTTVLLSAPYIIPLESNTHLSVNRLESSALLIIEKSFVVHHQCSPRWVNGKRFPGQTVLLPLLVQLHLPALLLPQRKLVRLKPDRLNLRIRPLIQDPLFLRRPQVENHVLLQSPSGLQK